MRHPALFNSIEGFVDVKLHKQRCHLKFMHLPYHALDIEEVVMDASFFNERALAV